jgi:hypothetical protein
MLSTQYTMKNTGDDELDGLLHEPFMHTPNKNDIERSGMENAVTPPILNICGRTLVFEDDLVSCTGREDNELSIDDFIDRPSRDNSGVEMIYEGAANINNNNVFNNIGNNNNVNNVNNVNYYNHTYDNNNNNNNNVNYYNNNPNNNNVNNVNNGFDPIGT